MLKCNFTLQHGCSPVSLLHIFRTPFPKNTSGRLLLSRSSRPEVFCIKDVLRNFVIFTGPETCNCIKKESLAHVFSCKFCEISKNPFSYRTPLVAASVCPINRNQKTDFL